jgi:endonuclease/exonuclease/phosphatase family metal-dependent hydrolase
MKLVSANIEGDLHLDKVGPFLRQQNADVICLQEVFVDDLPDLLGRDVQFHFLPMTLKTKRSSETAAWGTAIAHRLPGKLVICDYYHKPTEVLVPFNESAKQPTIWHGVIGVQISSGDRTMNIYTTHFTWTPDGAPDANQRGDMAKLLALLADESPHVLCGDFNIPRQQNSLYGILTRHYTDHVPPDSASSIYLPLHYVRHDAAKSAKLAAFMVDYIFSTPGTYRIENFAMHGGVSDHFALSAEVAMVQKMNDNS